VTFRVQFDIDNDAFVSDPVSEAARILAEVRARILREGTLPTHALTIFDSNGNDVGRFKLYTESRP